MARPGTSPRVGSPLHPKSLVQGGCDLSSSPCARFHLPGWAHPEPSVPGTDGRPAAFSRLLIPRDKSRSVKRPEEAKRRL